MNEKHIDKSGAIEFYDRENNRLIGAIDLNDISYINIPDHFILLKNGARVNYQNEQPTLELTKCFIKHKTGKDL